MCRTDLKHKNCSVEIIHRRNARRCGTVSRHASFVKAKYHLRCALSHGTLDLHYHHLDGKEFYSQTKKLWMFNGICLNATIHR